MLKLDHLAVACTDLDEGTAWVEERLGVTMQPGGKHARYGTHNRLLGLADGIYLEVIAIDPDVSIDGPRWFGLDTFSGPPRLANWICQTDDFATAPTDVGPPRDLNRDDLHWQLTVPDDGSLPWGGAYPTLIKWPEGVHPSKTLTDVGCRLIRLEISHPDPDLAAIVGIDDPRLHFKTGPLGFGALIATSNGEHHL